MNMTHERPALIIDSLNLFVRSFSAYPQLSSHGYQMGGTIGYLKTLRRIVSEMSPSRIYIAWESGGSPKRRAIYSEYKLGRRPEKLNRFYGDDIPESEENRKHQLLTLLELTKKIPVCHIYVPDCEGDDIISYLCKGPLRQQEKIVASSDKDMYQLLDDKTSIYSFHKKTYVTPHEVMEEFRVTPSNFALAKAICGDPSDNIPGVKGVGFKSIAQKFPFLGTNNDIILQDVFDYCHSHMNESKIYKKIIESKEDVKRNWRLVYLDDTTLSPSQATKVDNALSTFEPRIDRMSFTKILIREGINDFNVEEFFYAFHCIDNVSYGAGVDK